MMHRSTTPRWFCAVIFAVWIIGAPAVLIAAEGDPESRPPANQMCPEGAYVIGFDAGANIICSQAGSVEDPPPIESTVEAAAASEERCHGNCQAMEAEGEVATEAIATQAAPAELSSASDEPGPAITGVEPKSALYGSSRVTLTVSGTGFNAETIVKFAGSSYSPSVNQAGTRLEVTVPIRDLAMGNYALTVSNGPGMEATRKRALVIY